MQRTRAFWKRFGQNLARVVEQLPGWLERLSNVRLHGGVVTKVTRVLIVASASMAAIAWSAKLWWVSLMALVFVFGLCFPMLWRLINFADKNPQAALFEGAEFLAHERLTMGTKDAPLVSDESPPRPPENVPRLEVDREDSKE